MPILADTLRGELAPDSKHWHRSWEWLPAHPGQGRDGTLVLKLTHGRRQPETKFYWYAVQLLPTECDIEKGIWAFLLENEREPDLEGPIHCVVGGMMESCNCEAGRFDRTRIHPTGCKHRSSLAAIIREGGM